MNTALHRVTKEPIEASSQSALRNRCVCPECSTPVIHIGQGHVVAHFRHSRGMALSDCSLYSAGPDFDTLDAIRSRARAVKVPKLYFQYVRASRERSGQLALWIPYFENAASFQILNDSNNPGRIQAADAAPYGRMYPVTPNAEAYRISIYEPGMPSETLQVSGLEKNIVVFQGGLEGGLALDASVPLRLGSRYFAITHCESGLVEAPYGVELNQLPDLNTWKVFSLQLPKLASEELRCWVKEMLGKEVAPQSPKISIVAPTESSQLADGVWLVPEGKMLWVGIRLGSQRKTLISVSLVSESGHLSSNVSFSTEDELFLKVNPLNAGYHELRCRGGDLDSVIIQAVSLNSRINGAQVGLAISGHKTISLWDDGAAGILTQLIERKVELENIIIPDKITLSCSVTLKNGTELLESFAGSQETQSASLQSPAAKWLAARFNEGVKECKMSAGDFGFLDYPRGSEISQISCNTFSRSELIKLRWLSSLSSDLISPKTTPDKLESIIRRISIQKPNFRAHAMTFTKRKSE